MRSKVLLGVLGLGPIFFLSGCMLLPPETGLGQRSLVPLANETLELPEVQDLIGRLEAEGYTPLTEAIFTQEFLGSAFTFIPLAKEERSGKERSIPRLPPKDGSKGESNGSRGDDLAILSSEPVIPLPPSAIAYVVHWNGGVMGVLPREGSSFQVLYPDGERTYRVVSSPGSILEQLRENERFLSFERWLLEEHPLRRSASSPLRLFVSRAFLDETLGVVYIILTLRETTPRGPYDHIRTVSEDEDLKPLREYLVWACLAKEVGQTRWRMVRREPSLRKAFEVCLELAQAYYRTQAHRGPLPGPLPRPPLPLVPPSVRQKGKCSSTAQKRGCHPFSPKGNPPP